eukprot:UN07986
MTYNNECVKVDFKLPYTGRIGGSEIAEFLQSDYLSPTQQQMWESPLEINIEDNLLSDTRLNPTLLFTIDSIGLYTPLLTYIIEGKDFHLLLLL